MEQAATSTSHVTCRPIHRASQVRDGIRERQEHRIWPRRSAQDLCEGNSNDGVIFRFFFVDRQFPETSLGRTRAQTFVWLVFFHNSEKLSTNALRAKLPEMMPVEQLSNIMIRIAREGRVELAMSTMRVFGLASRSSPDSCGAALVEHLLSILSSL